MRWLLEREVAIRRFSQSVLLQVPDNLTEAMVLHALQQLLDHHDALRFRLQDGRLEIAPRGTIAARSCLARMEGGGYGIAEETAAAEKRLDPANGVMVQAVWLQPERLLLCIHHLAVDGVSWRILLEDLGRAFAGETLPTRSTSFHHWAERLEEEAQRAERVAELPLWVEMLSEPAARSFDRNLDPKRDTAGTAGRLQLRLLARVTARLLSSVPAAFHTRTQEVLLAALAVALAAWRRPGGDSTAVLVDVEGHGREEIFPDVDVSRTVGWFTDMYPIRLDGGGQPPSRALKLVKEQLQRLPDHGIGYGLLRYLNRETGPVLAALPRPDIGFNYLGRLREPHVLALEGGADPEMPLAHGVEVNALAVEGADGPELRATWTWAPGLVSEGEVRDLAERWFTALELLAEEAERPEAGGLTPSDVPLVSLEQSEIERLESRYGALEEILPLTPLQEGLLFHALRSADGRPLYRSAHPGP
jgi:non-ribosomal peptide synthase protein (TIGR01720 family)